MLSLFNRSPIRRLMSSMRSVRRVLVTDPCYVKNPDEYSTMISEGIRGTPSSKEPGHYVSVPVTESFFSELKVKRIYSYPDSYILE